MTPTPNPSPELLPCPFCGERLICDPNEGAPFWVHRDRIKSDCWLADSWVKDEAEGEGGILEWNTRALSQTLPAPGEVERLRAAIGQALQCTPHIATDSSGDSEPYLFYDCGDPWEILRDALATVAAANDEGVAKAAKVADDYAAEFKGKADCDRDIVERRIFEAHHFAAKNVASAIRLLSQGEGKS